mgnify:CR=1 FL=1
MAFPTLTPTSTQSAIILPVTGTASDVLSSLPFGIYTTGSFVSGAVDQVAYTFRKLGGDILDLEIKAENVYANYEEAVLEYSYIMNMHQGKNVLSNVLGSATASFNNKGDITSGPSGSNLKYPRYSLGYSRRVGDAAAAAGGFGGTVPQYSASFKPVQDKQDYDLQNIISSSSASGVDETGASVSYSGKVGNKRVITPIVCCTITIHF